MLMLIKKDRSLRISARSYRWLFLVKTETIRIYCHGTEKLGSAKTNYNTNGCRLAV